MNDRQLPLAVSGNTESRDHRSKSARKVTEKATGKPAKKATDKKPLKRRKPTKPPKASCMPVNDAFNLAVALGWTHLNPEEKKLIDILRWTTYHGRALVMEVASSLRISHPWVDGGGLRNTASPLRLDDRQYGDAS